MKIQDSFTFSNTYHIDRVSKEITSDGDAIKTTANRLTDEVLRCIELARLGYFEDRGNRDDVCFVRGDSHPIYFSVVSGCLSDDEFKKTFKNMILGFFEYTLGIVDDNGYDHGTSEDDRYTESTTCHWSFEDFNNGGEMEINFRADNTDGEFRLNIVMPEC